MDMRYKDPEKRRQYMAEYYRTHKSDLDERTRKYKKEHQNRMNRLGRERAIERRRTDPDYRERRKAYSADYYRRNRAKEIIRSTIIGASKKGKARISVRLAIASGKIIKPKNCESCGAGGRLHGHHSDYNKPLDVLWLCPLCHGDIHRALKIIAE